MLKYKNVKKSLWCVRSLGKTLNPKRTDLLYHKSSKKSKDPNRHSQPAHSSPLLMSPPTLSMCSSSPPTRGPPHPTLKNAYSVHPRPCQPTHSSQLMPEFTTPLPLPPLSHLLTPTLPLSNSKNHTHQTSPPSSPHLYFF